MLKIVRCFQDIHLFKAVSGMTYAEFNALLPGFVDALNQEKRASSRSRPVNKVCFCPPPS